MLLLLKCLDVLDLVPFEQGPLPLGEDDTHRDEDLHEEDADALSNHCERVLSGSFLEDLEYECGKAAESDEADDFEAEADLDVFAHDYCGNDTLYEHDGRYDSSCPGLSGHVNGACVIRVSRVFDRLYGPLDYIHFLISIIAKLKLILKTCFKIRFY